MDYLQKHKDTLIPELRKRWEAAGFKTSGSWEQVFGAGVETDEIFMAWNYARYVGHVAAAGKAEYPLPMFVNTWLRQGTVKPSEDIARRLSERRPAAPGDGCLEGRRAGHRHSRAGRPRSQLRRLVHLVHAIRQPAVHPRVQGRRAGRCARHRHGRQVRWHRLLAVWDRPARISGRGTRQRLPGSLAGGSADPGKAGAWEGDGGAGGSGDPEVQGAAGRLHHRGSFQPGSRPGPQVRLPWARRTAWPACFCSWVRTTT